MVDIHVSELRQDTLLVTLVEVSGRVDSMNADELGAALTVEIERGGRQIVLDLSKVNYMSSAGLRELVAAYNKLHNVAGDLRLAQPSSRVQDILEMSGLDTIFQIFTTQLEAVGSYQVIG